MEKMGKLADEMEGLAAKFDETLSEIDDAIAEETAPAAEGGDDSGYSGNENNRGKFVCRNDGHLFFHAVSNGKKLRFHIHPNGHSIS